MSVESKDILSLDDNENDTNSQTIRLTVGNNSIVVDKNHLETCELIKNSLESDPDAEELPLPGIKNFAILEKIGTYLAHHKDVPAAKIPKPIPSNDLSSFVRDNFDVKFVDIPAEELYDLVLAANYLACESLLQLGCAKIASMIKGQSLDHIKEILTESN